MAQTWEIRIKKMMIIQGSYSVNQKVYSGLRVSETYVWHTKNLF